MKRFDLRATDFLTGRKVSPPRDKWRACDCCGLSIVKGWESCSGQYLGDDCRDVIDRFDTARRCFSKTAEQFREDRERIGIKMKPAVFRFLSAREKAGS